VRCCGAAAQRLATCSSDRVVKIFELSGETRTHLADLTGHDGPVRLRLRSAVAFRWTRASTRVSPPQLHAKRARRVSRNRRARCVAAVATRRVVLRALRARFVCRA
jgi:hypothetical protein